MGTKISLFGREIFKRESYETGSKSLSQIIEFLTGGTKTNSGVNVTPEKAMEFSAVYGAVRIIAKTIASLDINVVKRDENGTEKLKHNLNYLLQGEPSTIFSKFNFWERVVTEILLNGNCFILIKKDKRGIPENLSILDYTKISVIEKNGDLFYKYEIDGAKPKTYLSMDILHFMELNTQGYLGKSPIDFAKENIGTGIAAQNQQGAYFGNGTRFNGYLKFPNKLTLDAQEKLSKSWLSKYGGTNAYKTPVLEEGMEYVRIDDDPSKAQTIETRRFTVEEVARVFGVPLHLLQDLTRSTNNNIEHQSIEFVQHCIRPRCEALEDEMDRKLLTEDEKHKLDTFIEFDIDSLLRGDIAARMNKYQTLSNIGVMTPNEIRSLEGLKKSEQEGADKLHVNSATVNLEDTIKNNTNEGSQDI